MRILAVSDTESEYIWDHFDESRFEGVDLMISCGDLKSQYLSFLITMIKAPCSMSMATTIQTMWTTLLRAATVLRTRSSNIKESGLSVWEVA